MHDGTDIYVENLTDRELQVLALLASGRTNAAIAAMLVISPFTVGNHLRNIYGKLGVTSRSAATRAAFERGLVRGAADAPQSPSRPTQLRMLHPSQSIRNAYSAVARFMPAAS